MSGFEYRITIDAEPASVYAHFTEAEGLLRWMAAEATVEPVPGGRLSWTHENGAVMIGRFVDLDPPNRLVFRYGWQDDRMGIPPESTTVEVRFVAAGDGTEVTVVHRDLPEDQADAHRHGWVHFLTALADCLSAVG